MPVRNQTALISGASSGLGEAMAEKFSREGYDILLLGRDEKKLNLVSQKCTGAQTASLAFDLKDFVKNSDAIQAKLKSLSPVSILVNNAGVFHRERFLDTSDEAWLEQFHVNLLSAVQLTKLVWPAFIARKAGSILNIASTLGVKPAPLTSAYSAIKAAMINWTLCLAQEGGAENIRANCICPGVIDTPIHQFNHLVGNEKLAATKPILELQLLKKLGTPTDVAEAAFFLATDLSSWTTGSVLHVDGGINIT